MASKVHNARTRNISIMRIAETLGGLLEVYGLPVPALNCRDRDPAQREARTLKTIADALEELAAGLKGATLREGAITPETERQAAADREFISALLRDRSKAELAEMVTAHGLDISTGARKEDLIEALATYAAGQG